MGAQISGVLFRPFFCFYGNQMQLILQITTSTLLLDTSNAKFNKNKRLCLRNAEH